MFPFYSPWKHQETFGFLIFSGGIKWEHCPEMGQDIASNLDFFESSPNKSVVIWNMIGDKIKKGSTPKSNIGYFQ